MEQESSRLLGNSLAIEVGSAKVQEPAPIKAHPGLLKIVPCWWRLARLWFAGACRWRDVWMWRNASRIWKHESL